jgi:cell division protein FtsW (lipid II flippase)
LQETHVIDDPTLNLHDHLEPEAVYTARTERLLLLVIAAFVIVNFSALMLLRQTQSILVWLPLVSWIGCAIVGTFALGRWLPRRDPLLFPLMMFLTGWGIVIIERLTPFFADRQAVWLILSVAVMVIIAVLPQPLRWLRVYRYSLLVFGLLLLVSTIILGSNPTGQTNAPQLWLGFQGFYFQPSELLKVMLVAFLASYLGEQYPSLRTTGLEDDGRHWFRPRILGPILLMWSISILILIWQRDLGTAILFFAVFMILLYVASGSLLIIATGAVLTLLAGFVAYNLFDVVQLRVDIWINPWAEASGRAYQIVQSLMAFGAGGVFGQGVGQGLPMYIPVVHSDFIFAALAEEWGLLGVIAVVGGFGLLTMRGLHASIIQHERPFYALLAIGLSVLIAAQSLLIMGGVLKLVPLTGVTLPFLSYGGSSLLMSSVMIGLLLRLSAE